MTMVEMGDGLVYDVFGIKFQQPRQGRLFLFLFFAGGSLVQGEVFI
jgi:hypothetical protein